MLNRESPFPFGSVKRSIKENAYALATVKACCLRIDGDCWIWNGRDYPRVQQGEVHRLIAQTVYGKKIDGSLQVHHRCANPKCVNFTHLQVVTPEENLAEMFERKAYTGFIASCVVVIRRLDPANDLLSRIPAACSRQILNENDLQ